MNYRLIIRLLGNVMRYEAVFMLPALIVSLIYNGDDRNSFIYTMLILILFGTLLANIKPSDSKFRSKEGFVAVALSWVTLSLFGALPFYFSGYFNSYIDCVFEAASGFTTTGASILEAVEPLPKGILFWRSFTHWIGGMGVLVFMLALMPNLKASAVNLLKAESPGPSPSKIVPKIRETAKIMYIIYFFMTVAHIILLVLTGMPLYDSLIHAFGSAGTGGFSSRNISVGAYNNPAAEIIIGVFMLLFGINFTLYFYLLKKNFKGFFLDEELLIYIGLVTASVIAITVQIFNIYGDFFTSLRHAFFQVSSVVTTTGYSSVDFNTWPTLSKAILVMLMFTGCCAGSTGGGIKMIRILILFKGIKSEIYKVIHPKIVNTIKVNKIKADEEIVNKVFMFFFVYFAILGMSVLIVSLDGKDLITTVTAVIATLSNIGPGLEIVGPMGNFSSFSNLSKIILTFCMIAGRLEFYPVLLLFAPSIWRKGAF